MLHTLFNVFFIMFDTVMIMYNLEQYLISKSNLHIVYIALYAVSLAACTISIYFRQKRD